MDPTPKVQYTLNKSSRRKRVAIKVHPDCSVEVCAPAGYTRMEADLVVESKRSWICRKQHEFAQRPGKLEHSYGDGDVIYYKGTKYTLKITTGNQKNVLLHDSNLVCVLGSRAPGEDDPDGQAAYIRNMVIAWYRRQALEQFTELVSSWCAAFPELSADGKGGPGRLTVRMMSRRWGSCDTKGNLTFSTRLVCAPTELINYVVVHELCHRLEFSHRKPFYDLTAEYLTDVKQRRERLRDTAGLWTL